MKKWQFIHVFIGLFVIICCNNDDKQINNFEQEQNNKEYLTALKLIQGFSKEQNQDLSLSFDTGNGDYDTDFWYISKLRKK